MLLLLAFVGAASLMAQVPTRHGQVTSAAGSQVQVALNPGTTIPVGVTGVIFYLEDVGPDEKVNINVARVEVTEANGSNITVRVIEASGTIEAGYGVHLDRDPIRIRGTGTLVVQSVPTGADIYLDGGRSGTTQRTFELNPGNYRLRLTRSCYEVSEQTVRVVRGERQSHVVNLTAKPPATVTVASAPDGAQVFLDDELKGVTGEMPLAFQVPQGDHQLRLSKVGYQDTIQTVPMECEDLDLGVIPMEQAPVGTLVVRSEPDSAIVYVDSLLLGTTELTHTLQPGTYTLRVIKRPTEMFEEREQVIEIKSNDTLELNITIPIRKGLLAVQSNSPDADVVVDGLGSIGTTPLDPYELAPGTYLVRVRNAFGEYADSVAVVSRETTPVEALLPVLRPASSADIEGVDVRGEGDRVVITYDLTGTKKKYKVDVALSNDGGRTFSLVPTALDGAVGKGIQPGQNKRIVWRLREDFPNGLSGGEYQVQVTARKQGGGALYVVVGALVAGAGGTVALLMGGGGGDGDGGTIEPPTPTSFPAPPGRPGGN